MTTMALLNALELEVDGSWEKSEDELQSSYVLGLTALNPQGQR